MAATGSPEQLLADLGIDLPRQRAPIAHFLPWQQHGDLLYLSGQGPRDEAGELITGTLGAERSAEQGRADARQVGLQILASLQYALGTLDKVEGVVKLLGMVNATADFRDHPKVIDGCSEVLTQVLGKRGEHARSAVGMASLPGGMSVEVEAIVRISPGVHVREFDKE